MAIKNYSLISASVLIFLIQFELSYFCDAVIINMKKKRTIITLTKDPMKFTPTTDTPSPFESEKQRLEKIGKQHHLIKPLVLIPAATDDGKANASLIFLHGLCESGAVWEPDLTELQPPSMRIISPTANRLNIPGRGIRTAWFSMNVKHPTTDLDGDELRSAIKYVQQLIDSEIESGIPADRIMVGGCNQGAALAVSSALTYPKRLGGLLLMSPWIPMISSFEKAISPAHKGIPIFQCYCQDDPVVNRDMSDTTASLLKMVVSRNLEYMSYRNKLPIQQFEDMKKFFQNNNYI